MPRRGYQIEGPRAGGMTRLAADAGISQATMSRLLSGRGEPSYDSLRKIGNLWGYSLQQMMVFAGLAEPDEGDQVAQAAPQATKAATPGVHIEQVDDSHVQARLTIATNATMAQVEETLEPLSPNERAMIANMEALEFPPAEICGAILMLRRFREHRAGQQDAGNLRRNA